MSDLMTMQPFNKTSSLDRARDIVIPESGSHFLKRWIEEHAYIEDHRIRLRRWMTNPTPREDIAAELGVSLGQLLRRFNSTAPLSDPISFVYRRIAYGVRGMYGLCDDVADNRYPLFGAPLTLRCYIEDRSLMPQGMYEAADWNFMDAGIDGFVGYAYGVLHEKTLYLAGLQSDLAVRYSYLFQERGETTEVRRGDDVVERSAGEMKAAFGQYVSVLRRTFQRYWIQVLLGACLTWAERDGLDSIGLLQFERNDEENQSGHVVQRVYRILPDRLNATMMSVWVDEKPNRYAVASLASIREYLGERWHSGKL